MTSDFKVGRQVKLYLILLKRLIVKFIGSEKVTNFCKISTLLLTGTTQDKSKVEISQKIVAFSEYMNFKDDLNSLCISLDLVENLQKYTLSLLGLDQEDYTRFLQQAIFVTCKEGKNRNSSNLSQLKSRGYFLAKCHSFPWVTTCRGRYNVREQPRYSAPL